MLIKPYEFKPLKSDPPRPAPKASPGGAPSAPAGVSNSGSSPANPIPPAISSGIDSFREMILSNNEQILPEHAGAATHVGTRNENQDCAGVARMGSRILAVVADGMGGRPGGGEASMTACRAAYAAVRKALERGWFGSGSLLRALGAAFDGAHVAVSGEARARGFGTRRPGFGTTLMIVLADFSRYFYGYLGDGGMLLRRGDGRVEILLEPQRLPGHGSVISGALGPDSIGEPEFGIVKRDRGDLLLMGTDGLFDVVSPWAFANDFNRILKESVQEAAENAVAAVSQATDSQGAICDDNLSLVAVRTPRGRVR